MTEELEGGLVADSPGCTGYDDGLAGEGEGGGEWGDAGLIESAHGL